MLHILIFVDASTTTHIVERLFQSLDVTDNKYFIEFVSTVDVEFKYKSYTHHRNVDKNKLEEIIQSSLNTYVAFLRWSDVVYPEYFNQVETLKADFVFDQGGDWITSSDAKIKYHFHLLKEADLTFSPYEPQCPCPRLVLMRRAFLRTDMRLPVLLSDFASLQSDVNCYLRCRQQEACKLASLKYTRHPIFIKMSTDYDASPFTPIECKILQRQPQYVPETVNTIHMDDIEYLETHICDYWASHVQDTAERHFNERKWKLALQEFTKIKQLPGSKPKMAWCLYHLKRYTEALSIAENDELLIKLYYALGDDEKELQLLKAANDPENNEDIQDIEAFLEKSVLKPVSKVKIDYEDSDNIIFDHKLTERHQTPKDDPTILYTHDETLDIILKNPTANTVSIKMFGLDTDDIYRWTPDQCELVSAVDGKTLEWTGELAEMFYVPSHLLLVKQNHRYLTNRIGTFLSNIHILKEETECDWVCVLQDNVRGLTKFTSRLHALIQMTEGLTVVPDVVFLYETPYTERLAYGLAKTANPGDKTLGYIIRKQSIPNDFNITQPTMGEWLFENLECATAVPPLIWKRQRSIARISHTIKLARPKLVVYGQSYPFLCSILETLTDMYKLDVYVSKPLSNASFQCKALDECSGEIISKSNSLLLIDTIDILLKQPIMVSTTFWFTGNVKNILDNRMLAWYASRNNLPIHSFFVNHVSQKNILNKHFFIEDEKCHIMPLCPITTNITECKKVYNKLLCLYNPRTFDKIQKLLDTTACLRVTVLGNRIQSDHLSYARKSKKHINFYGNLDIKDIKEELESSEYFWVCNDIVNSMDLYLVSIAQRMGCICIANCGNDVLHPDDVDNISSIISDEKSKLNVRSKIQRPIPLKDIKKIWNRKLWRQD